VDVSHPQASLRGLKKKHEWLCAAFALTNLYQHRRRLAGITISAWSSWERSVVSGGRKWPPE
jgi:hypothetical protein